MLMEDNVSRVDGFLHVLNPTLRFILKKISPDVVVMPDELNVTFAWSLLPPNQPVLIHGSSLGVAGLMAMMASLSLTS